MRLFAGHKWLVASLLVIVVVLLMLKCNVIGSGVRVTISKETTYITEPLRPDGYPDYVAALNERFSRGVTPENNSAVLFWQAVGPAMIPQDHYAQYFYMLGIPPLPETGDYFVAFDSHVTAHIACRASSKSPAGAPTDSDLDQQLRQQLEQAMKRPWSREEFPVLAEWLTINEKPLAVLIEASKRPRRYDPLIATPFGDCKSETVVGILLGAVQSSRDVARALVARSMLQLQEGKTDEAWQDLMACHRLSRLVGQGFCLIEAIVAMKLDDMARAGDQCLLEHGKLTPAQIAAMRKDLADLPPMPKTADRVDECERFAFLDTVILVARDGINSISMLTNHSYGASIETTLHAVGRLVVWDDVLRMGNTWVDRLVEASRKPTRKDRKKAFDKIQADAKKLARSVNDLTAMGSSLVTSPRRSISEWAGQLMVGLLLPGISSAVDAEDRWQMESQLNDLAFALAAYRADHSSYPEKLADLAPKYIAKVSKDIFNDADLHYQRQPNGYLLYSVGPNGIDDGGKCDDESSGSTRPDDLIIRIPSAQKPQQHK